METFLFSEAPQARFDSFGVAALSDAELVSLAAGCNRAQAIALLAGAGSTAKLAGLTALELQRHGLGVATARRFASMTELMRRASVPAFEAPPQLNRPELIYAHMLPIVKDFIVEKAYVLCLNRQNRLIRLEEISSGSATSTILHQREVFRTALIHSSAAIIVVHNHPSGDPAPSCADLQITRQLREAARAVDVQLLDHVIVGQAASDPTGLGYYSFRTAGLL